MCPTAFAATWHDQAMSVLREGDRARVAVVVVMIAFLQLVLPQPIMIVPRGTVPIVLLLGLPIVWIIGSRKGRLTRSFRWSMQAYLCLLIGVTVFNALTLLLAVMRNSSEAPIGLLIAGFIVLGGNLLSFGVIYWWLDAADPAIRAAGGNEAPDFLFPQQAIPDSTWVPTMMDYIYVSFTNLLAFSPTDTMPLRHRTKLLFMLQSTVSTFSAVVILGHAINSLPN